MKCSLCHDGVVGIVYATGELPEPLYCTCNGEGAVIALPLGAPYVEDARDDEGGGIGGVRAGVAAEAR